MSRRRYDRRAALRTLGVGTAALVAGCTGRAGEGEGEADAGDADDLDAGHDTDAGQSADAGHDDDAGTALAWATGGTAAMAGGYPDPFDGVDLSTCALTCAATQGPCYGTTSDRVDISEGVDGLPVRLAFKVVSSDGCTPLPGAVVDVWHCAPNGLYSGQEASDFCTGRDADARASRWFRGVQTTDAAGRVDFDTCLPGWYPGRAVHIHLTVKVGADAYVTSQVFFDQDLLTSIFATHPVYTPRGQPDTPNDEDGIASDEALAAATLAWRRMADGAMQASRVLVVRSTGPGCSL